MPRVQPQGTIADPAEGAGPVEIAPSAGLVGAIGEYIPVVGGILVIWGAALDYRDQQQEQQEDQKQWT